MRALIVLAVLVTISMTQGDLFDDLDYAKRTVLDNVHTYRFVQHDLKHHKLLIALSDTERECHVIEIDSNLLRYLKSRDSKERVTEEIYHLIRQNKQTEVKTRASVLAKHYRDWHLQIACRGMKTFNMTYHPSTAVPTHNPSVMSLTEM